MACSPYLALTVSVKSLPDSTGNVNKSPGPKPQAYAVKGVGHETAYEQPGSGGPCKPNHPYPIAGNMSSQGRTLEHKAKPSAAIGLRGFNPRAELTSR